MLKIQLAPNMLVLKKFNKKLTLFNLFLIFVKQNYFKNLGLLKI